MKAVAEYEHLLAKAREKAARLDRAAGTATDKAEAATPGGRVGYDPALLSGITRKPNPKAQARRFAAYDREAHAVLAAEEAHKEIERLERGLARAKRDEAAPCDIDSLEPGDAIRTALGWQEVVRVNKKSVTVHHPIYPWDDRVDRAKVIETRKAKP